MDVARKFMGFDVKMRWRTYIDVTILDLKLFIKLDRHWMTCSRSALVGVGIRSLTLSRPALFHAYLPLLIPSSTHTFLNVIPCQHLFSRQETNPVSIYSAIRKKTCQRLFSRQETYPVSINSSVRKQTLSAFIQPSGNEPCQHLFSRQETNYVSIYSAVRKRTLSGCI